MVLALGAAAPSRAAGAPPGAPDEALILEVRLRDLVLADGLLGTLRGGRVYLPLGELSRALEFAIEVDAGAGRARGWFVDEARRFELDLGARTLRVGSARGALVPDDAFAGSGEIFVEASRLSDWLELGMAVSVPDLQVVLRPRQPLPLDERLARETRRQRVLEGRRTAEGIGCERVEAPYAWLGWPFVDASVGALGSRGGGDTDWSGRYDAFVTADLLALGAELFVAGSRGAPLSQASLRLGRADPEGRLLGPVHASEVGLGDVFVPELPLVTRGVRSRGAFVSSFPLDQPAEFGRTTLAGTGPPGWEVELSRDGTLLDFAVVPPEGTFEFRAVPTLFGANVFTLTYYGPHGQRRQESRRLYAGPGLTPPGASRFRLGLTQQDRTVFGVSDPEGQPGQGQPRLSARWEQGLSPRFSVAASLASLPLAERRGRRRSYLGVGASGSLAGLFAALEAVAGDDGGCAVQLGAQTSRGNLHLLAEHRRFWRYESESVADPDALRSQTRARLELSSPGGAAVTQGLELDHEDHGSGASRVKASHRLSARVGPALATHRLAWERWGSPLGEARRAATGSLLVSGVVERSAARAELDYELAPEARLRSAAVSADRRLGRGALTLSVQRRLEGEGRTSASVGWSCVVAGATLSLQATADEAATWSAGMTVDFGLGREPASGSWRAGSGVGASRGRALARVAFDRNGNGALDAGDVPVEGASFQVNRSPLAGVRTDREGAALLPDLPPWHFAEVALDLGSLEDPYWQPRTPGFLVLARPGAVPVLTFLVQETGEIDGTVYVKRGDELRRAAGAVVQRVDAEGRVVEEATAGFDGFYLFQKVPLGTHRLRVAGGELLGGPRAAGPWPLVLSSEHPVASGVDWMVAEDAPRPR